jgi:AraC-like DNA-binding protein
MFATVPPGMAVIGARFHPGALSRWSGVPAAMLAQEHVDLEAVIGPDARVLEDLLASAQSLTATLEQLEAALGRLRHRIRSRCEEDRAIFRILSRRTDPGRSVVRILTQATGLSERTLRRRCLDAFGYGPKTLDRILRFQRFLSLAPDIDKLGLSAVALEAGYADASHLVHEAQELSGLTPTEVVAQIGFGPGLRRPGARAGGS